MEEWPAWAPRSAPRARPLWSTGFDRDPAYVGLADALVLLIGDGRIGLDVRLPSERELTEALGVSRTTVARAYARLRDLGYAEARVGAGTFTRVPGGRTRAHDRALLPHPGDGAAIDLNCAATSAPPGLLAAYDEALAELPAHLRRPRLLPGRGAGAAAGHRRVVRRPRPADRPRPARVTRASVRRFSTYTVSGSAVARRRPPRALPRPTRTAGKVNTSPTPCCARPEPLRSPT